MKRGLLLVVIILATTTSFVNAKTWSCVIEEVCSFESRCEVLQPPLAYRVEVEASKAVLNGDEWTREMRLIERTSQSEVFATIFGNESTMMTLFQGGILMQSMHELNHASSGVYGHYGRCQEITE
jgi:hypothetical protein